MPDGEVCIADMNLMCQSPAGSALMCSLPATNTREAANFLEIIGSGGSLGSGIRMNQIGVDMPQIREDYELEIENLIREVERRKQANQSSRQIAEWVVNRRREIANQMRQRSGAGTRVLFEVRDWTEYGVGGRSFRNVERRYLRRGLSGEALNQRMIRGATTPNTGISQTAIRGARYLRYGGRVLIVISVATTAYTLLTTPKEDLERVIYEEAGGMIGGGLGTSAAIGICLVFGIATGGWGLLACGIVGGVGGGLAGTYAADRVYYATRPQIESDLWETGVIDSSEINMSLPPQMCVAR